MRGKSEVDVLAVGAHPDDVEITCGGTVRKLVEKGYRVAILDLTRGERGSRGSVAIRKREADYAAKVLGVTRRLNLGLPDAFIENNQENRLKVVRLLRQLRPRLLIIPHSNQRHPDHRKSSELLYDSCHLSGLVKVKTERQKPHRPSKIIYSTSFLEVVPTFIVDITKQMDIKIQSVACYDSQFRPDPDKPVVYPPAVDIFDFIRTDAHRFGYRTGVQYGESFVQNELILIDDPLSLPVKSI